jgi:dipeptidase D
MSIEKLEPTLLWEHFAALNAVPRASKKEEAVLAFLKDFATKHKLKFEQDEIGNLLIKKPAAKGMESKETLVLQGHVDMVHQKNSDTEFDFDTQGINMYVDGDWVRAKGTTLGADNGLGVAAAMGLLASKDIPHPAIEALFTVDEEAGMTGALKLKANWLTGRVLLNMDTEEDHELTIGCAGGVDTTITHNYTPEKSPVGLHWFTLSVTGLQGGHSGMDIIRGLGNANKIMNRLLYTADQKSGLRIHSIHGGSLRNAIPRESFAVIGVFDKKAFEQDLQKTINEIQDELKIKDPQLTIQLKPTQEKSTVLPEETQKLWMAALCAVHNGVYSMSAEIDGLVETSSNLARVTIDNGNIEILTLQRSSSESAKYDVARTVGAAFVATEAKIVHSGDYPGWNPNPSSPIVELMSGIYRDLFKSEPLVNACHAGLECGIIGKNYPDMQMISFGPTIRGAHSPDERASISSAAKFWTFFVETVQKTPTKKEIDAFLNKK